MRNRALVATGVLLAMLVAVVAGMTVTGCEKRTAGETEKQTSTNEDQRTGADPQTPREQPAMTDAGTQPPAGQGEQPASGGETPTGKEPTGTEQPPSGVEPKPPAGTEQQPPPAGEQPPPSGDTPPPTASEQQTGGETPPAEAPEQAPPPAQAGNFKYVGVAACAICHKGAAKGSIHEIWLASSHAKAFENLGAENQKNPVCLACHTTGYGKPLAANVTPEKMVNVQCEACHGPGSEYKTLAVMKSREESLKRGLVVPTKELCLGCHGGKFPEGHPAVPAFDYASALKKIEHHSAPAAPAK